ncbi:MAG: SPASM domain-containing protein [Nitrospirota bacterium]
MYEIDCEGRRYFGNVSLKEFHRFTRNGDTYLFNIEKMTSHKISASTSRNIDSVLYSFGELVPAPMVEELRKIDLIDDYESENDDGVSDKADTNGRTAKKSEFSVSNIALFVAQTCNMRCVYCYGEGGEYGGKGMMREETAFMAVDWLMDNSKSAEKVNISFFGGEPLLNFPLIKRTVEYAKGRAAERNKKVGFGMTTNASLLTEEIISFMKEEKINTLVSFDGSADIQNRQRPFADGSGSYDSVIANIQKLLAVVPETTARATVYGDTDPVEIKNGMKKAEAKTFFVIKASPVILTGGNLDASDRAADEDMSRRMMEYKEKEWDGFVETLRNRNADQHQVGQIPEPFITGEKRYFMCGVGKGLAGISVSGDIYPCHRFAGQEDAKLGNIIDYKVEGINDYHRSVVTNLPRCSTCWARYICGGGCFYDNKSRTGDMRTPDIFYCNETKANAETVIAMYAQLDDTDKEYLKGVYRNLVDERLP